MRVTGSQPWRHWLPLEGASMIRDATTKSTDATNNTHAMPPGVRRYLSIRHLRRLQGVQRHREHYN